MLMYESLDELPLLGAPVEMAWNHNRSPADPLIFQLHRRIYRMKIGRVIQRLLN